MIQIAHPLVDETSSKRILKEVLKMNDKLISGIKPVTKRIAVENDKNKSKTNLVVFSAQTYPMDLITHLPIFCEENNIKYVFVEDNKWINNKTCVFLENLDEERYKKILKE